MKLHHVGIACHDIMQGISNIKKIYDVSHISDICFDGRQNATLCLIETRNNILLELISGDIVKGFLKKGISYYHLCYEVSDIAQEILRLSSAGCVVISPPTPAILFNDRKVAFLLSMNGMIELLEKD